MVRDKVRDKAKAKDKVKDKVKEVKDKEVKVKDKGTSSPLEIVEAAGMVMVGHAALELVPMITQELKNEAAKHKLTLKTCHVLVITVTKLT
jgi:hypothetical protein